MVEKTKWKSKEYNVRAASKQNKSGFLVVVSSNVSFLARKFENFNEHLSTMGQRSCSRYYGQKKKIVYFKRPMQDFTSTIF